MKWGCNYSKQLIALIQAGELSELDYIKVGAFGENDLEEAFTLRPLLLHGFGWYERIGMDFAKANIPIKFGGSLAKSVQRMNELAYYYESPHLAFHCLAYADDLEGLSEIQENQEAELFHRMKQNILFLKDQIEVPILIENIDYCPNYDKMGRESNLKYPVLPEVITSLVKETEIGFLFDLSHARVSAEHLGMTIEQYCQNLPMDRVKEIHLSGSGVDSNWGRIDVHDELQFEDYEIIKKLFQNKIPEYITLEYGFAKDNEKHRTSKEAILRQMKALHQIFGKTKV